MVLAYGRGWATLFLDFLKFYPLPTYTSDNDLLARLS